MNLRIARATEVARPTDWSRTPEDWSKLIGDVPSATAILDRFLHHAEIITITGRSYRLKDYTATERPPSTSSGQAARTRSGKHTAEQEACQEQSK